MFQNIFSETQIKKFKREFWQSICFFNNFWSSWIGFDSFNSDLNIRGVHLPKLGEILRYFNAVDTLKSICFFGGGIWHKEVDLVFHSLIKFLYLLTDTLSQSRKITFTSKVL